MTEAAGTGGDRRGWALNSGHIHFGWPGWVQRNDDVAGNHPALPYFALLSSIIIFQFLHSMVCLFVCFFFTYFCCDVKAKISDGDPKDAKHIFPLLID